MDEIKGVFKTKSNNYYEAFWQKQLTPKRC